MKAPNTNAMNVFTKNRKGFSKKASKLCSWRHQVDCHFQATQILHLETHQDSFHGGIKYKKQECDYKANQKSHLKTNQDSVHGDIKYKCNEYVY